MPSGGSHASRALRSTRAANTRETGAATTRSARTVLGIARCDGLVPPAGRMATAERVATPVRCPCVAGLAVPVSGCPDELTDVGDASFEVPDAPLPSERASIASATSPAAARDRGGGVLEHEQPRPGNLARDRLAVSDGEERVAATVNDERRGPRSRADARTSGLAVELENTIPIWFAIWTGGAVPGVRSQMRAATERGGDRVVTEDLRASGGESATASRSVQSGIGCANSRLIVVCHGREVIVGRAGGDRAGADQGEARERAG